MSRTGRMPALDGLRAFAVVAVLASHTLNRADGGFLGVDVFFVLSGFLITSLLLRELAETSRIDFKGFYLRRVARLMPAYLLLIVLTVPLMIGPLNGESRLPWPLAVAASTFYVANWAQLTDVGGLGPLLHTWSLSVEEQFYLVWPTTFLLLVRRTRHLARWIAAATLAGILLRALGELVYPGVWPYVATPTHGDGLLMGALLAVVLAPRLGTGRQVAGHRLPEITAGPLGRLLSDRWSGPLAWLGAAAIGAEMLVLAVESPATYWWGLTLCGVATVAIVRHVVVRPDGAMGRVLSWTPLVAIGRVSYGLYLYHMPIFMLVQKWHLSMLPTLALQVGLTTAISVASWFLVERPAQRWAARRRPRPHPPVPAPTRGEPPVAVRVPADPAVPCGGATV